MDLVPLLEPFEDRASPNIAQVHLNSFFLLAFVAPQCTVFTDRQQVLAAAATCTDGKVYTASDCRSIAEFQRAGPGVWISSPNMPFCPELPQHLEGEEFAYYADGMLGAFELLKWPQLYDQLDTHVLAAPVHPDLWPSDSEVYQPVFGPNSILHCFSDRFAPWFIFEGKDWMTAAELPHESVGFLHRTIVSRLERAAIEAVTVVEEVVDRRFGEREFVRPEAAMKLLYPSKSSDAEDHRSADSSR